MGEHIAIDGSHGEGGGQLLRTAVTLSAITGQALVIEHIRAGRRTPGLAAQHLTAVLSVAKLCEAEVAGATLSSETLSFRPKVRPQPGNCVFDVAKAREGASAGLQPLCCRPSRWQPYSQREHATCGSAAERMFLGVRLTTL